MGEFPKLRTIDAYPSNLPHKLSSFVGRDDEVRKILDDLRSNVLVTLTGVGGVGKTRLAVQTCAEALPHFPDGAWFVDLASLRDPAQVAPSVAAVLDVKERAGEELAITLRDALRERRAIVLLDNGEHLVDEVASLIERLTNRPLAAKFLLTTREPLGIDGEQVRRVASLESDVSVELFTQRASSVRSDVDWNTYERELYEICDRLDGIPLAIELAAARTRSMLPPNILRRLDERFRLLSGSKRTARERHQTLLAAVEWSYDLLTPDEQGLFNRLAVFRGSFDLAAAEAVCSGGVVDALDVVDLLDRLVDKSMVLALGSGGQSRYRLLETLRTFGETKLAQAGESDAVRDRHVHHYAELVAEWGAKVRSAEQAVALGVLDAEAPNVNAMFERLLDAGRWDEAVAACRVLQPYWSLVPRDGRYWFFAIEPHVAALSPEQQIDFFSGSSWALALNGFPKDALRHSEQALTEAARLGVEPTAEPYFAQLTTAIGNGCNRDAIEVSRRAIELAEASGDNVTALVIRQVVVRAQMAVEPERAVEHAADLTERARRLGLPSLIASGLVNQGMATAIAGNLDAADRYFDEAIEASAGVVLHVEISARCWRGLYRSGGDRAAAIRSLRECIDQGERHSVMPDIVANAHEGIALAWLEDGKVERAATLAVAVQRLREAINALGDASGAPTRQALQAGLADALDDETRQRAETNGAAMTRDEMRRYALES